MLKEMLMLMENNAKLNVTDLAALLNEREDAVAECIRDCESKGIIAGYHTIINWDKTNTDVVKAIIAVNTTPERDKGYDRVAEIICNYPEVTNLYLVAGKIEFLLVIEGKTMREISDFVAYKLAPTEGVNSTETMFILKEYKIMGEILDKKKTEDERLIVTP